MLAEEVNLPPNFLPHVTTTELERVKESQAIDRITEEAESNPPPHWIEISREAVAKAFRSSDDPKYRGKLLLAQLAACIGLDPAIDIAASLMEALRPRSTLEVLLLSQAAAIHCLVMNEVSQAEHAKDRDSAESHAARANKAARTFVLQLEGLQMLRSKGKPQRVIVKHVNVNVGGQAIMGSVTAVTGGG
jgi:hypothetical protein